MTRSGGVCQVCGESLSEGPVLRCQSCRTPHHVECWLYAEPCSTYGCKGRVGTDDAGNVVRLDPTLLRLQARCTVERNLLGMARQAFWLAALAGSALAVSWPVFGMTLVATALGLFLVARYLIGGVYVFDFERKTVELEDTYLGIPTTRHVCIFDYVTGVRASGPPGCSVTVLLRNDLAEIQAANATARLLGESLGVPYCLAGEWDRRLPGASQPPKRLIEK